MTKYYCHIEVGKVIIIFEGKDELLLIVERVMIICVEVWKEG